jgi:predicted transcriptional regulator
MANRKGNTQFQKGARVATSAFTSKQSPGRFEKDDKIEKRQAGIDRAVNKMANEGAKVDRMVKHIEKSEEKAGKSKKEAENIAWATANKRGMLDNKNKKK